MSQTASALTFSAEVLLAGKTATGVQVPETIVEALGSGKRPPVRVTIGAYTYRSTITPMNGVFMIPISAQVRGEAGVAAGDHIDVTVALDTEPRVVAEPADLAAALDGTPAARATFDQLSPSNKQWHVLQVTGAKTPETRQRRIEKSIANLREGRAR